LLFSPIVRISLPSGWGFEQGLAGMATLRHELLQRRRERLSDWTKVDWGPSGFHAQGQQGKHIG
jgi:hypothetical protein